MIGNGHDLVVSHPMHLQPFIKTTGQMSKFVALLLSAHVVPTPGCGGGNIGGGAGGTGCATRPGACILVVMDTAIMADVMVLAMMLWMALSPIRFCGAVGAP